LDSWRKLNEGLYALSEDEVLALLNEERQKERRVTVLERLHQRYSALRTVRERMEILNEAKRP
jgi:hypothetical protein